jgi:hypothetical protein
MDPIKDLALQRAVEVCGRAGDPEMVMLAAKRFEAYLRGASANDEHVRDALGNRLSDARVEALGSYK